MVLQIGKHKISIWCVIIITFILFTATACKSQTNIYEKELLSDEIIPTDHIHESDQAEIVLEQLGEDVEEVLDANKSDENITIVSIDGEKEIEPEDNIKEIIKSITAGKIETADVWWSHYPLESYRVSHFADEDFLNQWGSIQGKLEDSDLEYIMNTLIGVDYEILEEQATANTDFLILLDFEEGSTIRLTADDQEIYMSISNNDDWIHTKVFHIDLFEYLLGFAEEGGIDLDVISGTESVTICYVKEADRKTYPENGRITEIEITDSKMIKRIKEAVFSDFSKTMTYPSRENADIIFHTSNGDYYGKIKFPITTDENGISEPTIIIEGYYWYECEELYNILIEIENAQ